MKKVKAANGGASGTGISEVSFIAESQEKAESLAKKLLQSGLIADVDIISGGYERFTVANKKEVIDDSLIKMKAITADSKVQQVIAFIQENNPNEHTQQVQILASQMTGGNKDYIDWVNNHLKA